jgi:hypothetical protein
MRRRARPALSGRPTASRRTPAARLGEHLSPYSRPARP